MRERYLIFLLLISITLIVFWQVSGHEFINFDDDVYITANAGVQKGVTGSSISWAFMTRRANNWHPLTWLSHLLDVQLYGMKPAGHHATNLVIHVLNVLLLFIVFERLTGYRWRSTFVAALFAVHPLHVESVAWVAERKDVLCTLFWLLTIWAYLGYAERPGPWRYSLVVVLFGLGLLAKPMLVTLPFVLLLLDWWPLDRTLAGRGRGSSRRSRAQVERQEMQVAGSARASGPSGAGTHRAHGRALLLEKIPLILLAVASSAVTYAAQGAAVTPFERFPLGIRTANALVALVAYVWKMLWPAQLSVFYVHPGSTLPLWGVAAAGLALVLASAATLRAARSRPYLAVGWLWYVGTLIPVIGLIQVGAQAMADRYTYIPLIGLFLIVAWGVPDLVGGGRKRVRTDGVKRLPASARGFFRLSVLPVAGSAVIAGLMTAAWYRTSLWQDSMKLFQDALRRNPDNYLAHNNLGVALEKANRLEEAAAQYNATLRLRPSHGQAHNNLANVYFRKGRVDEAIPEYRKAIELRPSDAAIHNNLGAALAERGMLDEAISEYRTALKLRPDYAKAHLNLGTALSRQGKFDEAAREMALAQKISPDSSEAHNNMGVVLAGQGKLAAAIGEFREAIRIKPENAEAHKNLAVSYYLTGKYAEAWKEVQIYRSYGGTPPAGFIQVLSQKMPEP